MTAKRKLQDEIVNATRMVVAGSVMTNSRRADELKINPTDLQFMNIIHLFGELTPRQLAEKTGFSTPGVTVVLDRLEKAGFVRRSPNPNDRRSIFVRPALENYHPAYQQLEEAERKLLKNYSEKELKTILHFLTNISSL